MTFISLFHLFWVRYYSETSSPTVILAVIVYILILPVLLLVPKRLTATKDGEVIEGDDSQSTGSDLSVRYDH